MSNSENNNTQIGIVGAGIMGRGIAQLFAQCGYKVHLYDANAEVATEARDFIHGMLERQVERGKYASAEVERILANIRICNKLAQLALCDVLVEAVVESLDVKKRLFAELEKHVRASAILVSNTSSLLISDIASACARPSRVAGLHFFNPVPLMRLVEVIPAVRTAQRVVDGLVALIATTGHRAVIAQDQPGFLVNHAGRGFITEALRLLEEGVAAAADVDNIMREAMGFPMGPFELLDLTGLDVSGKVMQSLYDQFQQDPLFRPSSLIPPRMAAGLFGKKTDAGFYQYQDNQKITPAPPPAPGITLNKVWIGADTSEELAGLLTAAGATLVKTPDEDETIIVLQFWGDDVSSACARLGLAPDRSVAIDPLPDLHLRRTLMISPVTRVAVREGIHGLLAADGAPVTVINDSPGFVSQRILAMMVNIACHIAQRGIASVADIEDAVTLGLGYPLGPFTWGDKIGADRVAGVLTRLFDLTHDPRYRLNPWLRRRVQLGQSLLTEEASRV